MPVQYYPWAVFYRKSVFDQYGWAPPETNDDFMALMDDMQGQGVTPFAFGDKDGWPAMGTFDILNMRLNGFDFHMSLMAGEEAWDGDETISRAIEIRDGRVVNPAILSFQHRATEHPHPRL